MEKGPEKWGKIIKKRINKRKGTPEGKNDEKRRKDQKILNNNKKMKNTRQKGKKY